MALQKIFTLKTGGDKRYETRTLSPWSNFIADLLATIILGLHCLTCLFQV